MLIHLAAVADPETHARLIELFARDRAARRREDVAWVVEEMHARGSFDFARRCARHLAEATWIHYDAEFGSCMPSSHTELIEGVLAYVIHRACG
jgi:hypothetical protein